MTGQAIAIPSIPKETVRSAKAVFGPGNFYIQVGERLEVILEDIRLDCFTEPVRTSRAGVATLPLITFFEFIENLTDEQAIDAVRTRIDWKYALHLPVNPPVFRQNVLCEFRYKIIADPVGQRELQKLIDRLIVIKPLLNNPGQNFEILSLLLTICSLNRLNWMRQAMQQALGALAGKHPEWLLQIALPHWYGRFNYLSSGSNSIASKHQNELSLDALGADIHHLLEEVQRTNLNGINDIQEIKTLHRIWKKQFDKGEQAQYAHSRNSNWNQCDSCLHYADQ